MKEKNNYWKDDLGGIPQKVTFRNPLGEVLTGLSSMVLVPVETFGKRPSETARQYKTYKKGDKFP